MAHQVEISSPVTGDLVVAGSVEELAGATVDETAGTVMLPFGSGAISMPTEGLEVRDLGEARQETEWRFPLQRWTPHDGTTVIEPGCAVA